VTESDVLPHVRSWFVAVDANCGPFLVFFQFVTVSFGAGLEVRCAPGPRASEKLDSVDELHVLPKIFRVDLLFADVALFSFILLC